PTVTVANVNYMHELGATQAVPGAQHLPAGPTTPEKRRSTLARWFDSWMRMLGMALVLFLLIHTFLIEAFHIPTGSMEHTLLPGDFLFVNKAIYGAQIPGTHTRLPAFGTPRRGDVVVFPLPRNPEQTFVKRVVGGSGDNRAKSVESRYWGFVDAAAIKGRPLVVYFSYDGTAGDPLPWLTDIRWSRLGSVIR